MPERLKRLAQHLVPELPFGASASTEFIEVSAPASTAASLYEKIRNSLEYQEEHLLRRNAILRILKRFVGTHSTLESTAGNLLRELVWAKYLPNKVVPVTFVQRIAPVLAKYEPLLKAAEASGPEQDFLFHFVLDVLATEIEYTLQPPNVDEALASFMYEEMKTRTEWDPTLAISEEDRDLRFYVAVHRALLKSTPATLRFRLFTLYYPTWKETTADDPLVAEIAGSLSTVVSAIEGHIHHPLTERLTRLLRRRAGIIRVLGDVLKGAKEETYEDPETLDHAVAEALDLRTKEFRVRLRRTVVRAIIFLVITKMFLALLLEVPYDALFFQGKAPLYPLFINILFHPAFLAVLSLTVKIPQKQNAEDYKSAIRALSVGADHPALHIRVRRETRGRRQVVFDTIYGVLFLAVYGAIGYGLHAGGFHLLSVALFLFFISLVTFFAIRIRTSTRDIVASDSRSGLFGTIFDTLLLPIVRVGAWLSVKVSKINVFIYFFDFIIEAPLKVAIQFIEGWLAFVREKREEI
ncbi:MAG: hypothetical protein WC802_00210 [Patescibacteria group bacterium]|jgi:hypothetical protein